MTTPTPAPAPTPTPTPTPTGTPEDQLLADLGALRVNLIDQVRQVLDLEKRVAQLVAAHMNTSPAQQPASSQAQVTQPASPQGLVAYRVVDLGQPSPSDYRSNKPATIRQSNYITSMCRDKFAGTDRPVRTMLEASRAITQLQKLADVPAEQRDLSTAPYGYITSAPAPEPEPEPEAKDVIDLAALRLIPDGRYAVTSNDSKQTIFLRLATRKTGHDVGARVVQQRHGSGVGNKWSELQKYYPSGKVYGRNEVHGTLIADMLTEIMMNKAECADRYGARFKECSNCGADLTDDKSRYYRLGSECIKHRQDIVDWVDSNVGPWHAGAASRD